MKDYLDQVEMGRLTPPPKSVVPFKVLGPKTEQTGGHQPTKSIHLSYRIHHLPNVAVDVTSWLKRLPPSTVTTGDFTTVADLTLKL